MKIGRIIKACLLTLFVPPCLLLEVVREVADTLYLCGRNELRYLPRAIGDSWAGTFRSLVSLWRWAVARE
jgi:hypothetical protein